MIDPPSEGNETANGTLGGKRKGKAGDQVEDRGLPPSASGLNLKLSYYALLPLLFLRILRFCFLPGGPPDPPAPV
jgi:hypothetical protein